MNNERYTFEDLKNEEVLVEFLVKVWTAGFNTAGMTLNMNRYNAIKKYLPDFKKELSK